ncbi:MAG: four helix bundle protein [Candidatus Moraniibacteriota bacterium]
MEAKQKIQSFTGLVAWQKGHKLVLAIYKATKVFPKEEMFGLTNQMRRAVVSITSNIAEGFNRKTAKDKTHFYAMAHGSVAEIQNQLLIARDVQYLNNSEFSQIAEQTILVHKLLTGLIKSLSRS